MRKIVLFVCVFLTVYTRAIVIIIYINFMKLKFHFGMSFSFIAQHFFIFILKYTKIFFIIIFVVFCSYSFLSPSMELEAFLLLQPCLNTDKKCLRELMYHVKIYERIFVRKGLESLILLQQVRDSSKNDTQIDTKLNN